MKSAKIIAIVNNEYRMRRESAKATAFALREKAYALPEIDEATTCVSAAQFALARNNSDENAKALQNAEKNREYVLSKFGFDNSSFEPKYSCSVCHDEGIVDGKYCACFTKRYYEILRSTLGIESTPSFTFKNCNFKSVKDDKQREYLKKLYSAFERYAEKYPGVNTLNAIVTGGTGVGKSCLMSAVANRLTERGFNVLFISAVQLDRLMLNYHTSPVAERGLYLNDLIDCDMLIIDDLGSEQKIRNVTDEYLLMILNEREMKNKPVFITTNLSENQLKTAYPERIFSRLANKKTTTIREIIGNDLRLT